MSDERVNAKLTDEAAEDLRVLRERTGLDKTDIVNRALSVYAFIDAELAKGTVFNVTGSDGTEHRLMFVFGKAAMNDE
jgi:predicted Zn-dependent protease